MSTTLAKPAEMVDRKWYVIDAAGKPLGWLDWRPEGNPV